MGCSEGEGRASVVAFKSGEKIMIRVLSRVWLYVLSLVAALVAVVTPAYATVPAGVETVFTTVATDFGTVVGYGWTAFLVIVGGLILFGLVRRVISKSIGR